MTRNPQRIGPTCATTLWALALLLCVRFASAQATVANDVCWWGDALFGPHLIRCLGLRGLHAEIQFDDRPIEGQDRFALSENAQATVTALYASLDPAAQTAPTAQTTAYETELAQAL